MNKTVILYAIIVSLVAQSVESAHSVEDLGSIPGVGKIPWRRKWQPLESSCLEDSMDRRTWWATFYGVTKSRT